MTFDSKPNQAINQFRIGNTASFPQFRIHADRGESRHRVNLVYDHAIRLALNEEVNARQSRAVDRLERAYGVALKARDYLLRQLCRHLSPRGVVDILVLIIVEFVARDYLARKAGHRMLVAEDAHFYFAPVYCALDDYLAVVARGVINGVAEILLVRRLGDADR